MRLSREGQSRKNASEKKREWKIKVLGETVRICRAKAEYFVPFFLIMILGTNKNWNSRRKRPALAVGTTRFFSN